MSEKRFERVYGDVEVVCIDHHKNGDDKFFTDEDYDKFVECLNALHEENQKQEKIIRAYRTYINDFVKKEIEKRDYPICFDCKHQNGTWVNDREVDTWCQLKKTDDCDKTFECEYFEEF